MISIQDYNTLLHHVDLSLNQPGSGTSKLLGLVCAHFPDKLTKELLERMEYFHHRSGPHVDFYWLGYHPTTFADAGAVVKFCNMAWPFSAADFNQLRHDLEQVTRWRYSGAVEIILCNIYRNYEQRPVIDFTDSINIVLPDALLIKSIQGIPQLFESIFVAAENFVHGNPTRSVSKHLMLQYAKRSLLDIVVEAIPKAFRPAKAPPTLGTTNL